MAEKQKKIKLKAGLEIHQQLDTGKLFCRCPSILRKDEPDWVVNRKLHAVAGEQGEIDVAAQEEGAHQLARRRETDRRQSHGRGPHPRREPEGAALGAELRQGVPGPREPQEDALRHHHAVALSSLLSAASGPLSNSRLKKL